MTETETKCPYRRWRPNVYHFERNCDFKIIQFTFLGFPDRVTTRSDRSMAPKETRDIKRAYNPDTAFLLIFWRVPSPNRRSALHVIYIQQFASI